MSWIDLKREEVARRSARRERIATAVLAVFATSAGYDATPHAGDAVRWANALAHELDRSEAADLAAAVEESKTRPQT